MSSSISQQQTMAVFSSQAGFRRSWHPRTACALLESIVIKAELFWEPQEDKPY
jgi:hypothetical protein